jgi:hypothetical protein
MNGIDFQPFGDCKASVNFECSVCQALLHRKSTRFGRAFGRIKNVTGLVDSYGVANKLAV